MKAIDIAQQVYPDYVITDAYESENGDSLFCFGEVYNSMWVLVYDETATDIRWKDAHERAATMTRVLVEQ